MALSLMDVEMLTDIAIKTAKEAWEKSFSQRKYSLLPKVKAAKIKVIGKIASEILEHWLEEGIRPNDLEKEQK